MAGSWGPLFTSTARSWGRSSSLLMGSTTPFFLPHFLPPSFCFLGIISTHDALGGKSDPSSAFWGIWGKTSTKPPTHSFVLSCIIGCWLTMTERPLGQVINSRPIISHQRQKGPDIILSLDRTVSSSFSRAGSRTDLSCIAGCLLFDDSFKARGKESRMT